MGGLVSNFRSKGNDDAEEIKKHEERYENNPYGYAFADDEELQKVKWWQYLIYDMRFRIGYALIIGIILGIVIPVIIYVTWYDKDDSTIYGSCMIKEEARFQCLVNGKEPATREACIDALCCWNSSAALQYNCHYTFPSAFQYKVSSEQSDPDGGTITLNAIPNHSERMNSLRLQMDWVEGDEEHLNIQIFNPSNPGRTLSNQNMRQFSGGTKETSKGSLTLSYGDEGGYLFVRVSRIDSQETLIDTRLGPLNSGRDFISFTTTLPTPYFYGLKGGEGIDAKGSVTYGVVNGFENAEVPFYMSLEESGSWHGVLLETTLPFITQVLKAPAIMFYVQGTLADINLHVFPGPTPSDVFAQLHKYLNETVINSAPGEVMMSGLPYIPPYWSYGLHLCRKSDNASVILEHLMKLNELHSDGGTNQNSSRVIYDSDCIDEDLRTPFSINYEKFPEATTNEEIDIRDILTYLQDSKINKKILLTQKISIPWNASEWENASIRDMVVHEKTSTDSSKSPFVGHVDGKSVVYPDVFHADTFRNLSIWGIDLEDIPFDGIIMTDNFPKNEKALETCGKYESFLDRFLFNGTTLTDPDGNLTWGSVCPNTYHTLYDSNDMEIETLHADVHNVYGQQALKIFLERVIGVIADESEMSNFVISSSSMWTEGLFYGSRNGMEVAFSWVGLRESLAHYLQNFITSPFSGTPICGSFMTNDSRIFDPELCLRWYQVGLLLPFAYHSYGHANSTRGPLDLPDGYQRYLNEAVRQRYTYAPYYYTLAMDYRDTLMPPITPMSFYSQNYNVTSRCSNDRKILFNLVDQFMIGEGLLASPIVKPMLNRATYFPPGVWYDVDGFAAYDNMFCGGNKVVTGYIHQTPLFIRGGHIIPTIQNPEGNTIIESRQGSNTFTLLVALLIDSVSHGKLHNENGLDEPDNLTFEATMLTLDETETVNVTIKIVRENNSPRCGTTTTSIINHLKLLGFPAEYRNVAVEGYPDAKPFPGDDVNTLRIDDLNIDWCKISSEAIVIITASR